jgi:integrase
MLELRWDDVDGHWRSLTIRDKVEGERTIPLTPYVAHLLDSLPRRRGNPWVFSSPVVKGGHMHPPTDAHRRACTSVGLEVSFHGLRRSFKSLTEWLEVPVGVVAQIQGHKPSATAEKHYTQRPLDLLRVHHERIEAWILEQAGVAFDASVATQGGLHVVQGGRAAA